MADLIKIDDTYTYAFDEGRVTLLRHGQVWVRDPIAPKAWIAAANEIADLRAEIELLKGARGLSVEELDAFPSGHIVYDASGDPWTKRGDHRWSWADGALVDPPGRMIAIHGPMRREP